MLATLLLFVVSFHTTAIPAKPVAQSRHHLTSDQLINQHCLLLPFTNNGSLDDEAFRTRLKGRHVDCVVREWNIFLGKQPNKLYRRVRQALQPPNFANSSISVKALKSNISIKQIINIVSNQSVLNVTEQSFMLSILSLQSNVRIHPSKFFVNVTVQQPKMQILSGNEIAMQMATDKTEMYIAGNRSTQLTEIDAISGKTNFSLTTNLARIDAISEIASMLMIRTWKPPVLKEMVTIHSELDPKTGRRELKIVSLTDGAKITVKLTQARIRVQFGNLTLVILSDFSGVYLYTGIYLIQVRTIKSPFDVVIADNIVEVQSDNASVMVSNTKPNVTIRTHAALMKLEPNGADISISTAEGPVSIAYRQVTIDASLTNSTTELFPLKNRITNMLLNAKLVLHVPVGDIALASGMVMTEISNGKPSLVYDTKNTTIQINAGDFNPTTLTGIPDNELIWWPTLINFNTDVFSRNLSIPGDTNVIPAGRTTDSGPTNSKTTDNPGPSDIPGTSLTTTGTPTNTTASTTLSLPVTSKTFAVTTFPESSISTTAPSSTSTSTTTSLPETSTSATSTSTTTSLPETSTSTTSTSTTTNLPITTAASASSSSTSSSTIGSTSTEPVSTTTTASSAPITRTQEITTTKSGDFVTLISSIVTIQLPPTVSIAGNTKVSTTTQPTTPNPTDDSTDFIITQFSVPMPEETTQPITLPPALSNATLPPIVVQLFEQLNIFSLRDLRTTLERYATSFSNDSKVTSVPILKEILVALREAEMNETESPIRELSPEFANRLLGILSQLKRTNGTDANKVMIDTLAIIRNRTLSFINTLSQTKLVEQFWSLSKVILQEDVFDKKINFSKAFTVIVTLSNLLNQMNKTIGDNSQLLDMFSPSAVIILNRTVISLAAIMHKSMNTSSQFYLTPQNTLRQFVTEATFQSLQGLQFLIPRQINDTRYSEFTTRVIEILRSSNVKINVGGRNITVNFNQSRPVMPPFIEALFGVDRGDISLSIDRPPANQSSKNIFSRSIVETSSAVSSEAVGSSDVPWLKTTVKIKPNTRPIDPTITSKQSETQTVDSIPTSTKRSSTDSTTTKARTTDSVIPRSTSSYPSDSTKLLPPFIEELIEQFHIISTTTIESVTTTSLLMLTSSSSTVSSRRSTAALTVDDSTTSTPAMMVRSTSKQPPSTFTTRRSTDHDVMLPPFIGPLVNIGGLKNVSKNSNSQQEMEEEGIRLVTFVDPIGKVVSELSDLNEALVSGNLSTRMQLPTTLNNIFGLFEPGDSNWPDSAPALIKILELLNRLNETIENNLKLPDGDMIPGSNLTFGEIKIIFTIMTDILHVWNMQSGLTEPVVTNVELELTTLEPVITSTEQHTTSIVTTNSTDSSYSSSSQLTSTINDESTTTTTADITSYTHTSSPNISEFSNALDETSKQTNIITKAVNNVEFITLVSNNATDSPRFEKLILSTPPTQDYLLSVGLKVKRSLVADWNFYDRIVEGLRRSYIEGRRRQLGLPDNEKKRFVRQVSDQVNTNEFGEDVNIQITSIDRETPQKVNVRFYVADGPDIVRAPEAKETFDFVKDSEVSAALTYPVTRRIEASQVHPVSVPSDKVGIGNGTLKVILVAVCSVLLLIIIIILVLCCLKRCTKNKAKSPNSVRSSSPTGQKSPMMSDRSAMSPKPTIIGPIDSPKDASAQVSLFPALPQKAQLISPADTNQRSPNIAWRDDLDDDDVIMPSNWRQVRPRDADHIGAVGKYEREQHVSSIHLPVYHGSGQQKQVIRLSPTQKKRRQAVMLKLIDESFAMSNTASIQDILDKHS